MTICQQNYTNGNSIVIVITRIPNTMYSDLVLLSPPVYSSMCLLRMSLNNSFAARLRSAAVVR